MKLDIYVAGRFRDYRGVRAVIDEITEIGHEITHDWTRSDEFDENGNPLVPLEQSTSALTPDQARKYAFDDRDGVMNADVVVLLADDYIYGALLEAGMAIAWNVEVWIVAPQRDSVFWYLSMCRKFNSIDEVYEDLRRRIEVAA